jgi:hypothetical protein
MGRLVKADGTIVSPAPFQIDAATGFCQYPSVAYSPDADGGRGGYLVTWHQNVAALGNANLVHVRVVSASGTPLGSPATLGSEATWWESSPMVDYAAVSQVFMVTWRIGAYQIRAARVSLTGQNLDTNSDPAGLGRGILVTTSGGERDPSVAYNPSTDAFVISYADFLGGAHVYARLVPASTGTVGAAQLLGTGTSTYITDATFSTGAGKYLVGWYSLPSGPTARFVNADGTPSGNPFPVSSRFGTYDSFGVAYNQVTRTALAVGQDLLSAENGGTEISDAGVPIATSVLTNAGGPTGNFYPQVSASTGEAKWLLTTAHNFNNLVAQFATSVPSVPPAPAPPTVTQNPVAVRARNNQLISFSANASGSPAPSVQWESKGMADADFTAIAGATTKNLTFVAHPLDSGKLFRARFSNASGQALTTAVTLVVPAVPGDFNGDGRSDPLVWRPSTGQWFSPTSQTGGQISIVWGTQSLGDIPLKGDLDGDGITDLVVWRPANGTFYWLLSSTHYDASQAGQKMWGGLGDVPLLADVDGDGKSDLIVWRPSTGMWYWLTSTSGLTQGFGMPWGSGSVGDQPMTADMDGDGLADFVVWRPMNGTFYWTMSSSNFATSGAKVWGGLGDKPLLGDIDGDGRADLVVWRPSNGTFYWLTSSNGYNYANQGQRAWGTGTLDDVPMLPDFDGDGRVDFTVWRPGNGTWYWLTSSSAYTSGFALAYGGLGDVPFH